MRRALRMLILCGAASMALPAFPAFADYFVILHTAPDNGRPSEIAAERVKRQLNRRCGISAKTTQTSALDEIDQDLMIVFLDSYRSRERAVRARDRVRGCIPDAYIKRAWWKGD